MKKKTYRPDTCRLCGRPLDDAEGDLCSACRAMESATARVIRRENVRRPRRRTNGTTRAMLILVCVLFVIFVGLVAASTLLYNRYDPQKFLAQLDAVLAESDAAALEPLLVSDDLAVSAEGAAALCLAFSEEQARAQLHEQLAAQLIDAEAAGPFPALSLVKTPVFLGYGRYRLGVRSAGVLLQAPARELRLLLDGVPYQGEQTADGVLYRNIFPGQYSCSVSGVTAAGQPVEGAATVLRLLQTDPLPFGGAMPVATLTVSGCLSDETVILVDGAVVGQRPENGVVILPQVAVGSTVSMRYTLPWGAVTTASVPVEAAGEQALAFTAYATQGGVPANDQLTQLLTVFLSSYLDAINNQDAARVQGCTEACRASVNAAAGTEFQLGHLFVYDAVSVAPNVTAEAMDSAPRVTCCMRMDYRTVDRTNNEEAALADYALCTFCWQDGWVLDTYMPTDEATWDALSVPAQG